MMVTKTPKYHIIGAGVAGLATAKFIKSKYPNSEIIVYEASAHLGGRCYSFYDKKLGIEIDNATHVVLGANLNTAKFLEKSEFHKTPLFYDFEDCKINSGLRESVKDIALALFNLPLCQVARPILLLVLRKLFPFTSNQLKVWFSQGNLGPKLIEVLSQDITVKTGWKLKGFSENSGFIYKLIFSKGNVAILPQDRIISALDAPNYSRLFGGPEFEYNEIINIFYRTSMQISLPQGQQILGVSGATAQWLFSSPGVLAVTISDAASMVEDDDVLARKVWEEIGTIRGHEVAFLPSYRVLHHKQATIKQDQLNNLKRPKTAQTNWSNFFICGDWTMKNWPCSIEAAIVSAKRAVKKIIKIRRF